MANNKSIQILRGEGHDKTDVLLDGQPYYDKTSKYLYMGDGSTALSGLEPLNIQGPTGPTGPRGIQGPTGATGTFDTSSFARLFLDMAYPVGGNDRYIQFPDMPEPKTRWPWSDWEIDTQYIGRVSIPSGEEYVFGATGGEVKHRLNINEMPAHTHQGLFNPNGEEFGSYVSGSGGNLTAPSGLSLNGSAIDYLTTGETGQDGAHNNMQPYIVVNYWKRTA